MMHLPLCLFSVPLPFPNPWLYYLYLVDHKVQLSAIAKTYYKWHFSASAYDDGACVSDGDDV
jgi:hypothetical protein